MGHARRRFLNLPSIMVVALFGVGGSVTVMCDTSLSKAAPRATAGGVASGPKDAATSRYDWLQFDGDPRHSGNNDLEITLGRSTVASLSRRFQATLPAVADGAPVYLASISTSAGVRDVLFVTTTAGHVVALDAQTGATLWLKQYGAGACKVNQGSWPCFTTSSPAIDPGRAFVYTYGLDGKVHKLSVADGTETTQRGWPEVVTLKAFDEKGSSPLVFATAHDGTTYLYAAQGGYPGDNGDYQGHLTAIDLSSGAQKVFNTQCSDRAEHFVEAPGTPDCGARQSAVWARAPVVYDPASDRIYLVTGNASYDPPAHGWGDSILELDPDGSGVNGGPLDSYTPPTFKTLQETDDDLGSTAPAILPTPAGSSVARLALQSGKDGKIRLINLSNLSGAGGPGHTGGEVFVMPVPQGGGVLTTPAVWTEPRSGSTWVFVTNASGIVALNLALDARRVPRLTVAWERPEGGSSPLVANGVLYYAGNNVIRALEPTTGKPLWSDASIGSIHWQSPIVANGALYLTDGSSRLNAYFAPRRASTSVSSK